MHSIRQAISTWLAQGNPAKELMLQYCRFQADTRNHLDIYCPHKLLDALLLHLYSIDWQAIGLPSQSMAIFSDTAGKIKFELNLFPEPFYPPNCCDKDVLGLRLLAELAESKINLSNPVSIVTTSNRGVFCSSKVIEQYQIQGGIDAWIDADLSPYCYPDHLQGNVDWIAKTSKGDSIKVKGNIRSETLNGVNVRVTEYLAFA